MNSSANVSSATTDASPHEAIPVTLTVFAGSKKSRPAKADVLAWPELKAVIDDLATSLPRSPETADPKEQKETLPAFGPYRLRPGKRRANAHVEAVTALMLDVDHVPDGLLDTLDAYTGALALYESPSSTPEARRFRLLAPVSREITPSECRHTRLAWAESLGLAPGCGVEHALDAARISFGGRLHGSTDRGTHWQDGAPVDVDALLARPLVHDWTSAPSPAKGKRAAKGSASEEALAKARLIAEHAEPSIEGHGGDAALFACARELATVLGEDAAAIESVLTETFNPRCIPAWDERKLRREAERAAEKESSPIARAHRRGVPTAANDDNDPGADRFALVTGAGDGSPILQLRTDAGHVLLWQGADRGHQPVAVDVLRHRIRELGLPIDTHKNGDPLPSREIIEQNGTTFGAAIYDFAAPVSRYEPEQDRVVVGYPQPRTAPKQDEAVDRWLRALGGDAYTRLESWIASCAQANIGRLAAALVIIGPADVGKTLIADALAGLWGQSKAPKAELLVTRFNGELCRCPIVLDDEAELFGSKQLSTKRFREIIQATQRDIERKGRERFLLRGTLRLVVPCNGLSDLRFTDVTGPDVVRAVADRLCIIDAKPREAECKAALVALRANDDWRVDIDRIVAHLAWLCANVTPQVERFIGAGGAAASAVLAGHVDTHAAVFERLRDWIDSPADIGTWCVWGGQLCVCPSALARDLATQAPGWDLTRVNEALAPFIRGRLRPRALEGRPRLAELDADQIAAAIDLDDEAREALRVRLASKAPQLRVV